MSLKKTLKSGVNSIKDNFESVKSSVKSVKSLSNKSLKNSLEKSIKSISNVSNKISNNNNLSYLGIFILIALTIGYYVNKHYRSQFYQCQIYDLINYFDYIILYNKLNYVNNIEFVLSQIILNYKNHTIDENHNTLNTNTTSNINF